MRTSYALILSIALSFSTQIFAQHEGVRCGTQEAMNQFYEKHPEALQQARHFNEMSEMFASSASNGRAASATYTIPVVFHVFGTDFVGQSVDYTLIENALQEVTDDFKGLSAVSQQVSAQFSGIQQTLDIEFKLAKIDPLGNATTGVTFNPELSGFGNGGGYDSQIQQYAWDNYKYMNVYIMLDLYNDGSTTNSGVAWYPDSYMSDNNLARVVYNGRYIGDNTSENFRRVLTHEFGHYLNLAHTFDNGCSSPGDHVADTPATTSNSGTCNYTVEMCSGAGPANGENFMDYSDCYRMFTAGQVQRMEAALTHPSRQPLWQPANLIATGVDGIGAHLALSATSFTEGVNNDGSVQATSVISANDGAAFATTGILTEGVHFTTSGVPAGLSVQINVGSSTSATLSFNGNASSHSSAANTNGVTITFLNAAISGGTGSIFSPTLTVGFNFLDPYQIVYEDIADLTVNASNTWEYFEIQTGGNAFGVWYSNGDLRLETYQKPMICQGSSRNLSRLTFGETISNSSNWVAGGPYPDEHDLRTSSYTIWDGQSGYLGFQVKNPQGHDIVGWFRVAVSANGDEYTLYDYAYNEDPNGSIGAGLTSGSTLGKILTSTSALVEANANNGSVPANIGLTVEGSSFASTGQLSQGTHYTVANLTSGLSAQINVSNSTSATLSLSGSANSHLNTDDVNNVTVTFLNSAIAGGTGTLESADVTFSIDFNDPYEIVYEDIADLTVDSGNTWEFFRIQAEDHEFGVWYENGNLRLETYTKPIVSEGSTRNISYIAQNQTISSSSNWVAGGAYPDEHDLRTSTYTVWDGQSGYIGFQVTNAHGDNLHGWFRVTVNGSGTSYTLHDYAYNEEPNASILAGQTSAGTSTPPVAAFSASATNVLEGSSISYTDQSTNSPTSWSWVFEGGSPSSSSLQNPTVSYANAGTYDVTLTVTNADGSDVLVQTDHITVNAPTPTPPVAAFTASNTNILEGASVTFTDQSSNSPTTWSWVFEGGSPASSNNQNPSVSYANAGQYDVTLTVTNADGSDVLTKTDHIVVTSTGGGGNYCSVSNGAPNGQYIERVEIGSIDNNTTYQSGGYSDFTSQSTTVTQGTTESITVTPHNTWGGTAAKAWIDWNQNGTFEGSEEVLSGSGTGGSYANSFNIPANALVGTTRMRVRTGYSITINPCGDEYFSEVEDYGITVQPGGTLK